MRGCRECTTNHEAPGAGVGPGPSHAPAADRAGARIAADSDGGGDDRLGLLRRFRHDGFVFRRQHPVERYIVDFCCPEERLMIELDGNVHAQPSQAAQDVEREDRLRRLGYTVGRFPNGIVLSAPEEFVKRVSGLVATLMAARPRTPSPPAPLPQRGEGRLRVS